MRPWVPAPAARAPRAPRAALTLRRCCCRIFFIPQSCCYALPAPTLGSLWLRRPDGLSGGREGEEGEGEAMAGREGCRAPPGAADGGGGHGGTRPRGRGAGGKGFAWSWGWLRAEQAGREGTALGRLGKGCLSNEPLLGGGLSPQPPPGQRGGVGAALRTPRMCQVPWVPCCWAPGAPTCPRGWWQQSRCQKRPAAFWLAPRWFSFWQGAAGACTAPKCLVVMLSVSPEHGAGDAQQPSVPLGRTSASQCAWGRSQWGQQWDLLS